MADTHRVDVAVFGGGIAGLWTLARLRGLGFGAVLVERRALGAGQTLASQGMIHGGQKYLDPALRAGIGGMPALWEACLEGKGEVDLRGARTLAPFQVMWSAGRFLGNLLAFAGSKFTQGHTELIENPGDYPVALREGDGFKGKVYRLKERVLDTKSLLEALRKPHAGSILRAETRGLVLQKDGVAAARLYVDGKEIALAAERFIFCAGAGNEEAARAIAPGEEITQRRPLKQVLVREVPHALYGHCIGLSADKPRVTITAHPLESGRFVWYLGGGIAEKAASMSDSDAVAWARREMEQIFPALPWSSFEWAAFPIDRAEPFARGRLPEGPRLFERGNAVLAWPSKMTFAPRLAEMLTEWTGSASRKHGATGLPLPRAEVGAYPWETPLEWRKS
jgi:glycine/D-amino acid oxidase-like deaminating enzyme